MSRLCVKNLPKSAKEDDLREYFSQRGEVTDAKLMRTADGKSRQFGFVGYRTEQEAEEAVRYFNKAFMGAFRISCEIARKIGDPNIPQPWSKYSKEKEQKLAKEGKEGLGARDSIDKRSKDGTNNNDDLKLQEFLQVMQPRSKSKLWADDTVGALTLDPDGKDIEKVSQSRKGVNGGSKKGKDLGEEGVGVPSIVAHGDVSDADYFKSKVKKDWSDSENDDHKRDDVVDSSGEKKEGVRKSKEDISLGENIPQDGHYDDHPGGLVDFENPSMKDRDEEGTEAGRLFIRNLPYTTTEDELEETFSRFGDIAEVHLVVDKETRRSKGFAYVLYRLAESARRALAELDGSDFQGRLLHVLPAKSKPSKNIVENVSAVHPKTFKQKREEQRKASEAGGDIRSWNTLFMRSDTIAENIARKYGVSKSDFLDPEASDLPVRMAAGETEIISETKKALASAGVNVGSLDDFASGKTEGMKRSNNVILVKNLPYNSSEAELLEMFGRYGSLDKVILPPTRTMALVVFLEPGEARGAFSKLAYKRYKDAPLYLEWAPSNILSPVSASSNGEKNHAIFGENEAKKELFRQEVAGVSDVEVDYESRSLFVKNLNFKTSEEILRKHMTENLKDGKVLSVRIKKHMKNGKNVSMGFGFVEFDSAESAANVCKDLQGTVLDGHALILQLCHSKRSRNPETKAVNDLSSTKLIVRNVAFEATEKELRQLFNLYGQVKSLRLPKKLGNHRGFAFVEYSTKQETQKALQSLSSTHFYGRHLVLERAKEGESLEELRDRTAAQFSEEQSRFQSSKKRKKMAASDGDDLFQE